MMLLVIFIVTVITRARKIFTVDCFSIRPSFFSLAIDIDIAIAYL